MQGFIGKPIFQRLSTKVTSGFIAIVIVFAALGLIVSHEITQVRDSSNEAMERNEAVREIENVAMASTDQIQAIYELILENNEDKVAVFESARERRDIAIVAARAHADSTQEHSYFNQLEAVTSAFDDKFEYELLPAWYAGDTDSLRPFELEADALLLSIKNRVTIISSIFNERAQQASDTSQRASAEARSYLILAAIAGITLSLFVTVIVYRRLNKPVQELKEAGIAMVRGDMERRVRVTTDDEVGELGRSFNMMAASVQNKISQLTHLSDIALAISSELDWSRVMDVVMEKGIELTGSDAAAIVLYDDEKQQFTDVYTSNLSEEFVNNMRFRRRGLAERVLFGDKAVFSDDIQAAYRLSKMARDEGITAFICLPLKVRKRKLGIFYVYSRTLGAYGREEVAVLSILSNQAAIAIQNARMFERSQEEAHSDGLTGLYNQRYFYERLGDELERAVRAKQPVSIIFCDLDHFKVFNDTNGHALGDQALRETARVIDESKRSIDIAARYGGEEFALILPDTDSSGAQIIAHRIRRRVTSLTFENKGHKPASLTVSVGVASFPADASSGKELVEKADWSMYFSKRHGRNRVTLFHEEAGEYGSIGLEELVQEEFNAAAAQALAASAGDRDDYDRQHSESVARLASAIAAALNLGEDAIQQIRIAGLLHDIGLVSVPAEIVNKHGQLSEEEWQRIREHPEIASDILQHVSSLEGFLPVIRHHHERFDGQGYPQGLERDRIPLGARIIAVADAYQAMTSSRPYRGAMSSEQAIAELQRGAGKQFDPVVVDIFVRIMRQQDAKAS